MRKEHILLAALLPLLIAGWAYDEFLSPIEQKIDWFYDYDHALKEAKSENRTLLIYFYMGWCSWCREFERETYCNGKVADLLNNNFICLKVDGGKQSNLVTLFRISGYPTVLLVSPQGKELGRIVGYKPPDVFIAIVSSYIPSH